MAIRKGCAERDGWDAHLDESTKPVEVRRLRFDEFRQRMKAFLLASDARKLLHFGQRRLVALLGVLIELYGLLRGG